MNELESILNYLETTSMEPHDDYTSEFSYKEQKVLWEYIKQLEWENQDLKKQVSNSHQIKNQQKEFIEYLETEKDRLARECSPIYEDGLGKTRLVSEDIFNEINDVLSKYKEIVGFNGN